MKLLPLLALASLSSPFLSPSYSLGASAVLSLTSRVVSADDSSIEQNLSSFGIDEENDVRYPKDSRSTSLGLVSLTEWGYADDYVSGYGLYVILYNPSETRWDSGGWYCTLGFPSSDTPADSVSSYDEFPMAFVDSTENNRFLKFFVDGKKFHSRVSSVKRRYCIGSVTASYGGKADSSDSLGQMLMVTGYAKGLDESSLSSSTLHSEFASSRSVSVPVVAFTSNLGTFQTNMHISSRYGDEGPDDKKSDVGSKTSVTAYSVLFSVPDGLDMGDLDSVHYSYYKYRTNWLLVTDRKEFYDSVFPFSSKSIAWYGDGTKASGSDFLGDKGLDLHGGSGSPDMGFRFQPVWDLDDRSSVYDSEGSLNPYSAVVESTSAEHEYYLGIDRFYNNNKNGNSHWNLRVPSFAYAWYVDDGTGLENHTVKGDQILTALDEMSKWSTSVDGLPRKGGYVNKEFVYVPSYSNSKRFYRYGYNDWSMSDELLSDALPDLVSDVLDGKLTASLGGNPVASGPNAGEWTQREIPFEDSDGFWSWYWNKSVDYMDADWDYHGNGAYLFETALSGKWKPSNGEYDYSDSQAYNHLFGSAGQNDRLLSGVLNGSSSDPFVTDYILSRYDVDRAALDGFLRDNSGDDVYRLTYDFGMTNTYRGVVGYKADGDGGLNGWVSGTPHKDVDVAKTDVVLDFQFLDLTFKDDSGDYHVLPASSDPVSSAGNVSTTDDTSDTSQIGRILLVAAIVLGVLLVLVVLPIVAKAVGGLGVLLKYAFKGLLALVEAVLWVPYVLIVYPVGKLAKKDVRVWPFSKSGD